MTDAELAEAIATEAGALLLDLRAKGGDGAAGDAQANTLILARLAAARPEDAVLSEERTCDGARLVASRVWIVDPLDGTREFGEGRDDWAVHIGLAIDGVATLGAVALPGLDLTLSSQNPPPLRPANAPLRMLVSRTRPAAEALAIATFLNADLVPMGSAGAKAMAVVRGEADIYLHSGGQYEWDNCAPVAVAVAAGLHCSRIDGAPLVYNCENPYLPDLLICRPELAAKVLRQLSESASSQQLS
ncbi:MAG: 3'(2'),5'-bisphosphate nucleotidase CysQ [Sphingomonadaceae bacterium]